MELATNVSNFIDFASKCGLEAHELEQTQNSESRQKIEILTRSLHENTAKVKFDFPENVSLLSLEDELCHQLTQQCLKISGQLLKALEGLKAAKLQPESIKMDETIIDEVSLDRIRVTLRERIVPLQWSSINDIIREVAATNSRLGANRSKDIEELASEISTSFLALRDPELVDNETSAIWSRLLRCVQKANDYSTEQRILRALHFWTMSRRQELISKEHENTFEWIFARKPSESSSQPVVNFADWLEKDEALYWISGKPGSGKSTIMKYIAESTKTVEILKKWAAEDKIVTANFYFWSSAKDSLQKSDIGLLRSILFQILRQCPHFIQEAFFEHWGQKSRASHQQLTDTVTNTGELLVVYQRISSLLSAVKVKFCFFIDGLDEYEGDSSDIARLIRSLSETPNLKACISSRPWREFEATFGGSNPWKLYVHELTENDMGKYVEDLLNKDLTFSRLREVEGRNKAQALMRNIVKNAEGVFLWVLLVVRSLVENLNETETIADLQSKLAVIPTDLETYFEQLLLNIDGHLRRQTAHAFLITLHAVDKLPLMCYWMIQENDLEGVESIRRQQNFSELAVARLQNMADRIAVYSTGLLKADSGEIDFPPSLEEHQLLFEFRVDFIHRTVTDFLRTAKMQQLLNAWKVDSFNVDFEICEACLATIQMVPSTYDMFKDAADALSIVHLFLYHAKLLESVIDEELHTSLLDDFVRSLKTHNNIVNDVKWLLLGPGNFWAYDSSFEFSILYQIASYDLGKYVNTQLNNRSLKFSEQPSGLLSGCLSIDPRVRTGKHGMNIDTIHLFLQRGLDPNFRWGDRSFSFWQQLLTTGYSKFLKGSMAQVDYDSIKHTIDHGADLKASIEVFGHRRLNETKAIDILEKILSKEQLFSLNLPVL